MHFFHVRLMLSDQPKFQKNSVCSRAQKKVIGYVRSFPRNPTAFSIIFQLTAALSCVSAAILACYG